MVETDNSLANAIRLAVRGKPDDTERRDQSELQRRYYSSPRLPRANDASVLIPLTAKVPVQQRLLTTGAGSGAGLVAGSGVMLPFGDALRQASLVGRLGGTIVTGFESVGSVTLPFFGETGSTLEFLSEYAEASESSVYLGGDQLTPKRAVATVQTTRTLIQNSDSLNQVSGDLVKAIAEGIDKVVFAGVPAANEPNGILTRFPVGNAQCLSLGTNGGELTFAKALEAERMLAEKGIDPKTCAWVLSAKTREKMKRTPLVSGQPIYLADTLTGMVSESPSFPHIGLPDDLEKGTSGPVLGSAIFGDFSQVCVIIWGTVEVLNNPYSRDTSGLIRVCGFVHLDVGLRNPGRFVVFKDVVTA